MAIKGVTFDWWGTIAAIPNASETSAMRELRIARLQGRLRKRGIALEQHALFEAYDRQTETLEDAWSHHRELTPSDQVDAFLGFAGIDSREGGIGEAVSEAFGGAILERRPTLFPNVRETLESLTRQGFAIGLISNTGRSWGRYLTDLQEAWGIGRYVRVRAYSDEHGVRKPDARIFDATLSGLGLTPPEVVHVGDDVIADIAGAKARGMRAVWFDTGSWPAATTDQADAEIHDHRELLSILGGWH